MSSFSPDSELMPHKTTADLILEQEGQGIVGPQSADPWPTEIWQRVDMDAVQETLEAMDAELEGVSRADKIKYTESSGIYFSPADRALLEKLGMLSLL